MQTTPVTRGRRHLESVYDLVGHTQLSCRPVSPAKPCFEAPRPQLEQGDPGCRKTTDRLVAGRIASAGRFRSQAQFCISAVATDSLSAGSVLLAEAPDHSLHVASASPAGGHRSATSYSASGSRDPGNSASSLRTARSPRPGRPRSASGPAREPSLETTACRRRSARRIPGLHTAKRLAYRRR